MRTMIMYQSGRSYICGAFVDFPCMVEEPAAKYGRNFQETAESLAAVNARFNAALARQIAGTLPTGYIYQLGHPGRILRAAGFPYAPIEMAASRLANKSVQANHPFDIADVYDLVLFINDPVAVFRYGMQAKNIIVDIERGGKQYLIGVHFNQSGPDVKILSVRGIFPKDNHEWLNWISQGKADYLHKEKIQVLIDQQRINPADVAYLNLDSVTKIVQIFENPKWGGRKF